MRKRVAAPFSLLADITEQVVVRLENGWSLAVADQLEVLRQSCEASVARPIDMLEFCDQMAQTIVCATAAWMRIPAALRTPAIRKWLIRQAHPLWREALRIATLAGQPPAQNLWKQLPVGDLLAPLGQCAPTAAPAPNASGDELAHLFEDFLQTYRATERRRFGVFFTPQPIVQTIMTTVEGLLVEHFARPLGWLELAKPTPAARGSIPLLDPAAGSGAFLAEAIRLAHCQFLRSQRLETREAQSLNWQAAVAAMMPQLTGYEVLLPACALAQLFIAATLLSTGFRFQTPLPLCVVPHNALSGPTSPLRRDVPPETSPACMVIVGNPPFVGVSANDQRWAAELLRGNSDQDPLARSYFHVDGQPLGERKVWLNDDYVKFFRFAQWQVDRAGQGILAFVSNHAYLDNATFRGMRASLLQTFPRITLLDLHGNAKRRERDLLGNVDENVFSIEQGVAIGYFVRPPQPTERVVLKGDLWGTAAAKLTALSQLHAPTSLKPIEPAPPHYLFTCPSGTAEGYPEGVPLNEVMPAYCTAPITARDHFIVSIRESELVERLTEFGDPSIDDDVIRAKYFGRTRSRRYAAGDTRGWKLSAARRRFAAECPDPRAQIRPCSYRPFDQRYVFWTDWMIDWPRPQLTRQAAIPGNFFLITRRQMLPGAAPNFFWITQQLALDGVIRSDNRGSEALFPLYDDGDQVPSANFARTFIDQVAQRLSLRWLPQGMGDGAATFGPEDLGDYIYALFWSATYRRIYAERFCSGFPPVLSPRTADVFRKLIVAGRQLRACHLLEHRSSVVTSDLRYFSRGDTVVARGYPRYEDNTIWINANSGFEHVPEDVWTWSVGTHQVCRKWLRARRGSALTSEDVHHLEALLKAIVATQSIAAQIENTIAAAGGLRHAMV